MTIISLESNGINGDFELLFADETVGSGAVVGLRMLRRAVGASTTVHDTNALYSAVAAASDDFQAMGFTNPMLPTTPNAYTMENGYFIPRSSTEFLFNGSVTSVGWGSGEIRSVEYTVGGGVDFVADDIGRQVVETTTTDTGTLLDFEVFPDGTLVAWIRPDDPANDLFDGASETLSVIADGGAGTVTETAVGLTGDSIFSSIQAIGSVPTTTEVYMVQDRFKMTDSLGTFQWWATDTTVSLGIIDVLARVQVADVLVDLGNVTLYARRYSSLYDHFTLDVSAGGRSAIPLSSAPDLNNTTGYNFFTGVTGSTVFQVGEVANEAVSGASIVITAVGGTEADPELAYYLIGDVDIDIFDSTAQTLTGVTSGATCTTAAPVVNLGGPNDPAATEGGTVTVNFGTILADHDGVGGTEPYSITIDAQSDVPVAKVYERIKFLLRRGAGDPFDNTIGMDGEQYKGIQQQAAYDSTQGSGIADGGELLTVSTGTPPYSARSVSDNAGNYVMLTDRRVAPALADNDLLEVTTNNGVTIFGAPLTVPEIKPSPFGSFTGSQIFGAVGVLYINPGSGDAQNYILLDDNQVVRTPPNTVTVSVLNTLAGDRVYAARDTGVAGTINKDQFGGIATAAQSGTVITVTGTVDTEVPTSGFVRIVENALQQEHHYVYDSRVTGSSGTFTLRVVNVGSASHTGGTETTQLIDSTATFQSAPIVEVGMLIRNTTVTKTDHVWEVTNIVNTTTLDVIPLYGDLDASQDWDNLDTYEINELIQLYDTGDDLYDLILDVEATTTSASNILVKIPASNFGVVLNVRQGKLILPFTQNGTVGDSGVTLTVVRSADTIATP